jgi:hypothetical protein
MLWFLEGKNMVSRRSYKRQVAKGEKGEGAVRNS